MKGDALDKFNFCLQRMASAWNTLQQVKAEAETIVAFKGLWVRHMDMDYVQITVGLCILFHTNIVV